MALRPLPEWRDVGARIIEARRVLSLTQAQLAERVSLDRTALAKIERGQRALSALELARIAEATEFPIEWFVAESPPVVASRRSERLSETTLADVTIDILAREVETLLSLDLLPLRGEPLRFPLPKSVEDAEQAAVIVRQRLGYDSGLLDLEEASTRLNLFSYVLELPTDTDGVYTALREDVGVALVNGRHPSARRRFTFAHELGHHLFQDEYVVDAELTDSSTTERYINAFAIHLLLPRGELVTRWQELSGGEDARRAATVVGAEYRLSWTALIGHLVNLKLVDRHVASALRELPPLRSEYLELGCEIAQDLEPPRLPRPVIQAALGGYRRHKLGEGRVLELLHGTVSPDELPERDDVPMESLAGDLRA